MNYRNQDSSFSYAGILFWHHPQAITGTRTTPSGNCYITAPRVTVLHAAQLISTQSPECSTVHPISKRSSGRHWLCAGPRRAMSTHRPLFTKHYTWIHSNLPHIHVLHASSKLITLGQNDSISNISVGSNSTKCQHHSGVWCGD